MIFVKSRQYTLDTLGVENFNKIPLPRTVKEIEANLCFSIFSKNSKFKMAVIFRERKDFWKLARPDCLDTLWIQNFDKMALSRTVKQTEANLCFCIFGKNSKWTPFLGTGNFGKRNSF